MSTCSKSEERCIQPLSTVEIFTQPFSLLYNVKQKCPGETKIVTGCCSTERTQFSKV